MRNFEYYTPTRIIFGKDTHYQIGDLLKQGNYKKVLIHYGSGSIVRSGLLKEITDSLDMLLLEVWYLIPGFPRSTKGSVCAGKNRWILSLQQAVAV